MLPSLNQTTNLFLTTISRLSAWTPFFFVLTTSIAAVLVTRGCVEIRKWSFPRERGKDQGRTQYKWMPVTVPLLCCAVVSCPSRMDKIRI